MSPRPQIGEFVERTALQIHHTPVVQPLDGNARCRVVVSFRFGHNVTFSSFAETSVAAYRRALADLRDFGTVPAWTDVASSYITGRVVNYRPSPRVMLSIARARARAAGFTGKISRRPL